MDINKVIYVASEAGRIILENGGETYRVEETMSRICSNFNVYDAESFVTPTGIMISVMDKDGHINSLIRRVKNRTVNLEKVNLVNALSRNIQIQNLSCNDIELELKNIESNKCYSLKCTILASAISAAFFTLLFGGSYRDAFVSFFIGGLIKFVSNFLSKNKLNDFFVNVVGGALTGILALISTYLSIGQDYNIIIIGSIMLLVPGLAITNAVRDTIGGDLLAALARGLEAILTAVAIAVGTGIALKIWFSLMGGM